MGRIITYLTFDGDCRQAMEFYQQCLGGELRFQTVGESPGAERLPQHIKDRILHATLKKGEMLLMGTDMSDNEVVAGNSVAALIHGENELEMQEYFRKLARGGNSTYPPRENYWGGKFGGLTDKFGTHWLFRYAD